MIDTPAAEALAAAAVAVAESVASGGTLWSVSAHHGPHAGHLAVEFLHPVIVGKAAIPAAHVDATLLPTCGRDGDVVVTIGPGTVEIGGLTHISLGAAADDRADHRVPLPGGERAFFDGRLVLVLHLLWETTQLVLEATDQASPAGDAAAAAFLYPFLDPSDGPAPGTDLASMASRIEAKAATSERCRSAAVAEHAEVIAAAASTMRSRLGERRGRLFFFGNGGSAADAGAVAASFRALPGVDTRVLHDDPAVLTALANDLGHDAVFARQVAAFAGSDDVVVGFSTSGDSANVLEALAAAHERGVATVGFTGGGGGRMRSAGTVDHLVRIDSDSVHRIQEAQAAVAAAVRDRVVAGWRDA